MTMKKLPVGIENFEEIRKQDFYYVDKTGLIVDLLASWGKVNLFTRPRRFGKTLNMSMLKCFFEISGDKSIFDGLAVSQDKTLCEMYMGKYPVVFVSLKGVDRLTFEDAYERLRLVIRNEAFRLGVLRDSTAISTEEKSAYIRIIEEKDTSSDIVDSLKMLCTLLEKHYGQKVILLIDEYDVPLDKAYAHGYYEQMIDLIRAMFGAALKTNDSLFFAVLTGCLRVSKESIFTGLNNLKVHSISDVRYDEYFGFTDQEVGEMLTCYGLENHHAEACEWYDGYRFGEQDVYCPWDVINFCDDLCSDPQAKPKAYWINTSSNDLVKDFVEVADKNTQNEIEQLIAGETIEKNVRLDLTYAEVHQSIDNLWSVLFTTGYLTHAGKTSEGAYKLKIPNREVREVFILQIQEWFKKTFVRNDQPMRMFCKAFQIGDAEAIQKHLNLVLNKMISVMDTKARDEQKENFYHGLLLGLLRSDPTWLILSNAESGDGFSDILIEPEDLGAGIVIKLKYASTFAGLDDACQRAMMQIRAQRYDERLRNDGRENIMAYGIAFNRKRCRVICEKL